MNSYECECGWGLLVARQSLSLHVYSLQNRPESKRVQGITVFTAMLDDHLLWMLFNPQNGKLHIVTIVTKQV